MKPAVELPVAPGSVGFGICSDNGAERFRSEWTFGQVDDSPARGKRRQRVFAALVVIALLGFSLAVLGQPRVAAQAIGGDKHWDPQFEGNGLDGPGSAVATDSFGDVYVGGLFSMAGDIPASNVARWDGASWHAVGSGVDGAVFTVAVSEAGDLFVGGNFNNAGGMPAANIAHFDGMTWNELEAGADDSVNSLAIDTQGDLYAGGAFTQIGGVETSGIAGWDGMSWYQLGDGISGIVHSVLVHSSGDIYIGGDITSAGGTTVDNVARWDGNQWHAVGSLASGSSVRVLKEHPNGQVYIGGIQLSTSQANVAQWDDDSDSWEDVGSVIDVGDDDCFGVVTDLAINSVHLYAAVGEILCFPPAEPDFLLSVSEWTGTDWEPLGSGVQGVSGGLALKDLDDLYVTGGFLSAGGQPSPYFARWNETLVLDFEEQLPFSDGLDVNVVGNPSQNQVNIEVTLQYAALVKIRVYDTRGRLVRNLGQRHYGTGTRVIQVADLSTSTYFITIDALQHNGVRIRAIETATVVK